MNTIPSLRSYGVFLLIACSALIVSCQSSQSNQRTIAYHTKSKNEPGYRAGKKKSQAKKKKQQKISQSTRKKKQNKQYASRENNRRTVYQKAQTQSNYPESSYTNCNASLSYLVREQECSRHSLNIKIDKSDYKLSVYADGNLIKEYPVVFGKDPNGDKLMQGDKRTPEGEFKVRDFYPHDKWQKFVWINYPTQESYQKHKQAKAKGQIPADASIGGSIGIHGVPDDKNYAITERQNWTLGCISMKNQDINELYPFVSKDMAILIND